MNFHRLAVAAGAVALAAGCDVLTATAQRAGVVPTFEAHCAKALPATEVVVRAIPVRYALDTGHSHAELGQMGVEAGAGERVIGLTRARISHAANITVHGIEEPRNRQVCVRPAISVEMSMQPMTVFVGREYAGDPCRRAVILEHEEKHVAVYREYLDEVAARVRGEIAEAYGNAVMVFASRDEAQREIETALSGYLEPVLARSTRELLQRQAAVDTPEEYARVGERCGGVAVPVR